MSMSMVEIGLSCVSSCSTYLFIVICWTCWIFVRPCLWLIWCWLQYIPIMQSIWNHWWNFAVSKTEGGLIIARYICTHVLIWWILLTAGKRLLKGQCKGHVDFASAPFVQSWIAFSRWCGLSHSLIISILAGVMCTVTNIKKYWYCYVYYMINMW